MGFQRRSFVASRHHNGSLRVESSAFYCLPSRPFPDEPDRIIELFSGGPFTTIITVAGSDIMPNNCA